MKLKISKKWLNLEYLWFYTIIFLIYIKLTFSYLDVEISWWGKLEEQETNYTKYNFLGLPENFSGKMEFLLIPLLFIYSFVHFNLLGRFKKSFIILLFLLVLNIITFLLTKASLIDSISYTLKLITPILFFFVILVFSKKNHLDLKQIIIKILKFCTLLILIGLIAFDYKIRLNTIALPVYFGTLHTQSYIIAIMFIGISFFYYKKISLLKLLLFYIVTVLFLYIGYTVRTALIVYLIYITATLLLKSSIIRELFALGIVSLPFLLLILLLFFDIDFDALSSGRFSMYAAKYEMLKESSLVEILFGHGYRSDSIDIQIWAGSRGSHNDYLTYLVENGLLYMVSFIILIFSLIPTYKKINLIYVSLIVGYLFSSLISNGLAVRVLSAYLFFMILAFVYLSIWGVKEEWIKKELNVSN